MPVPINIRSVAAAAAASPTNGVERLAVERGELAATRVRGLAAGRDVRVLGEQQALEPSLLGHQSDLPGRLHRLGGEDGNAEFHRSFTVAWQGIALP
jgi:hypothetical protein